MMKSNLIIRPMQPEDLDEVCRIEVENFSQPWTKKGFLESINLKNNYYLTVLLEEKVVGYCGMQQVLDEADITNVAVDQSYRQHGIGTFMLTKLMEAGAERGVAAFTLEVRESNMAAIALYEKLGFENCGIRKNFYEKPVENAVIMWKR